MTLTRAERLAMTSVAANISRIRRERGLSQEELAELASFSARYVRQLESGTANTGIRTLARIAAALRVEVAALVQPAKLPPPKPGRPRGT